MKATELRVGNLINSRCVVTTIESDGCGTLDMNGDESTDCFYDFDNIRPIPLTEDRLVRLGYKFSNQDSHSKIFRNDDGYEVSVAPNTIRFLLSGNDYVELQFVHELQNLVFALYKEDITTDILL